MFPSFDHYSFRARLQPALFTLLPLGLAVFAWTGAKQPWMAALWTACGMAGVTFFLAVAVRNQGKKIEPKLWAAWGGAPTTQMLRHRGPANPFNRERWHKYLAKTLGQKFPSAEEESADEAAADLVYEAATKLLIGKTRDAKKYPLLYKESVSYGFCRNLHAMRPIGSFVAGIGVIACGCAALCASTRESGIVAWACTALSAIFLLGWLTRVSADWVKVPALAYADRLFEAIEVLSRSKSVTPAPPNTP